MNVTPSAGIGIQQSADCNPKIFIYSTEFRLYPRTRGAIVSGLAVYLISVPLAIGASSITVSIDFSELSTHTDTPQPLIFGKVAQLTRHFLSIRLLQPHINNFNCVINY